LIQARHLLQSTRASLVALTLGPKGAALLTRGGQTFHARENEDITVVDTVGAGDCFLAGLVTAMLGRKLAADWGSQAVSESVAKELIGSAIASASLCVKRRGCVPPTREEVQHRVGQVAMTFSAV
jgi:fructokinase